MKLVDCDPAPHFGPLQAERRFSDVNEYRRNLDVIDEEGESNLEVISEAERQEKGKLIGTGSLCHVCLRLNTVFL